MKNLLQTKWVFFPALFIGIIVIALLIKNRAQPGIIPLTESAKTVHVLKAPEINVIPLIKSNGTVKPGQVWRGVAEVNGEIAEIHPQLKKGAIISKGEIIIKIDPTDYELAIAQAQANINVNKAQLAELDVQENNTQSLLEIEKNVLQLSQNEVNRKKKLAKDKSISRAEYDQETRNFLNQKKSHANLQNTLALYPVQRERISAELKKLNVQLTTTKLNLQRATITMPFTGRVSEVKVERGQFVRQGELLTIVDGMKIAEIIVQIPIQSISQLLKKETNIVLNDLGSTEKKYALNVSATVNLALNGNTIQWPGKVTRISETIDLKTRTVGVIVEVDDPYKDIIPGIKPPLMKGMFVSVELRGQPLPHSLVVPRSAIYQSSIHVVTENNRLETRNITTTLESTGFSIVSSGLNKGEQVVISDLVPAIDGMLLNPVNDEKALQQLIKNATIGAAK